MTEFSGTHGTSITRAINIKENGFQLGTGFRGKGVYFWRGNAYAYILAKGWYRYRLASGVYDQDKQKGYSLIVASIIVDDDSFIDIDEPEIFDQISQLAKAKAINGNNIYKLYDEFYDLLQEEMETPIKMVIAAVPVPREITGYPRGLGKAICYIVRDGSCIHNLKFNVP